jgi:signal transduction histidine kinase
MLFLKHAAEGSAQSAPAAQVPIHDQLAAHLERALLASDEVSRLQSLIAASGADTQFKHWVLRTAEVRQRRTVNQFDEAAAWLARNLAVELAHSFEERTSLPLSDAQWRLTALAKKLSEYSRVVNAFEARIEREKLDAMKELAYGASHEINNPLANIAARAQTLLEDEEDPQRRQKLIAIHRQAMRAHEMIADLMLFARPPKLSKLQFSLGGLVRRLTNELSGYAQEHGAQVSCNIEEPQLAILADETQIGVAIHALIKNAIEAAGDGGLVSIAVRATEAAEKHFAEIVVTDNGPGIPDEIHRHIFEPFFSGREAGRGLGFGLSKCWRIVTEHGGQVVVGQSTGRGTEISIFLPLLPEHGEPAIR